MIIRDHYQNFKSYNLPKAQLIIADIPYNIGINAYGSNPSWYIDGDNSNGESELAGKKFFSTDDKFNSAEFMHFCSKMMRKEPKKRGCAPAMILFCSFEQQRGLIDLAKRYGINKYINLVFRKNFSAQVLKANMRVVSNAEYGLLLFRDKLPKFNNKGKMVYNIIDWQKDKISDPLYRKIHPTQKPIVLLERLIKLFTDEGDVVADPVAGSGSTIIAAENINRKAYGFEIDRKIYQKAKEWIDLHKKIREEINETMFSQTLTDIKNPGQLNLFQCNHNKTKEPIQCVK